MSIHEDAIDTFTHKGYTVNILIDQDCPSPRENDNLGTIVAWHRNYNLSDEKMTMDPQEWKDAFDEEHGKDAVILSVFMFEHSGIALSTSDFGDRWDSGQVGWIYCTREKLIKEFSCDSPKTREQAAKCLKAEIEEYGRYVNGECYGYVIEGPEQKCGECGHVERPSLDSCWGFIGDEYVRQEAKASVENIAKQEAEKAKASKAPKKIRARKEAKAS